MVLRGTDVCTDGWLSGRVFPKRVKKVVDGVEVEVRGEREHGRN